MQAGMVEEVVEEEVAMEEKELEPLDLLLEPSLNDLLLVLVVVELAEVEEVLGGSMEK